MPQCPGANITGSVPAPHNGRRPHIELLSFLFGSTVEFYGRFERQRSNADNNPHPDTSHNLLPASSTSTAGPSHITSSIQVLHASRVLKRADKIVARPSRNLFETLPSGTRLRPIETRTSHHKNSSHTPIINF